MGFVESRWFILFTRITIFFFPCRHLGSVCSAQTRGCSARLLGTARGPAWPLGGPVPGGDALLKDVTAGSR